MLEAVTAREYADVAHGPVQIAETRSSRSPTTSPGASGVISAIARASARSPRRCTAICVTTDLAASLSSQAYVAGVDGHVALDSSRDWMVTGGLSTSLVSGTPEATRARQESSARYYQRPDATHLELDPSASSMTGWNAQVDLNRNGGSFRPNASVWAVSPGFEANDLGFQTSADRRGTHAAFSWRKPTPDAFSRFRQVTVAKWYAWNGASELLGDGLFSNAFLTLPNYWSASASAHVGRPTRTPIA